MLIVIEAIPNISIHNPITVAKQKASVEIKIGGENAIGPMHNPVIFPKSGQKDPSIKLQIILEIGIASTVKPQFIGTNETTIIQIKGHIHELLTRSKIISTTMQIETGIIIGHKTQKESPVKQDKKYPHKHV
jgi:hypothetical protein